MKQQKSAGRMHDKYLQVAWKVAVCSASIAELEDDMLTGPTGQTKGSQNTLDSLLVG